MKKEQPFRATLKKNFFKTKKFTRFLKSKVSINSKGIIEVEILKGQESFRIKSLIESNNWAVLKSGKSDFKKGDYIECYSPTGIN